MGRAPCCEKVGLKKGKWTAEEDEILTKYIQANGEGSWRSLPKNAGLLRCGKSCRLRWINYLRADLKRGNISTKEETTIVKLHASFGNRWSLIASHLPGRTDNEIKNYWNSHLSRRIYSFHGNGNGTEDIITVPPKRKRGRTSRWAMRNQQQQQLIHFNNEPPPPDASSLNTTHQHENTTTTHQEQNVDTMCFQGDKQEILINDNIWGPYDDDRVINGGDAPWNFDDIIIDDLCHEPIVAGHDTCSNVMMSSGDLHSSSSSSNSMATSSALDQNLLTWLWEDEDWEKDFQSFGDNIDTDEKQNAMVDWFLSST